MDYKAYGNIILEELRASVFSVDEKDLCGFIEKIREAPKIYCDGKGRSGLQMKAFAMRLAQMGFRVYDASGVTTPAMETGDFLIAASGSGQTPNLLEHVLTAEKLGTAIALITASETSVMREKSNYCFQFRAKSKQDTEKTSIQPMGTLFEQSLAVFLDITVLLLMQECCITGDEMYRLHNNLE